MPIGAIHWQAALGKVPGEAGEAPLDRRDAERWQAAFRLTGGAGADVETDDLARRRQRIEAFAEAPAGEMPPVLGVGVSRVFGAGGVGIACGGLDEGFQTRRRPRGGG